MSTIGTKLVWSVTPFGVSKQGLPSVIDIMHKNEIFIVRFACSQYSKHIISELKNLSKQIPSDGTGNNDPVFMLEFVGRQCVICVPNENFNFIDHSIVEVNFEADFAFCAENKIENSTTSAIHIKVSSTDQLAHLKRGSLLDISYGSVQLEIIEILTHTENQVSTKCRVVEGGIIYSGAKVNSKDISRDLFPLLPEDAQTLKNRFYELADYLIVSDIRSEEELISIKKAILGESFTGSQRHPSVPIVPDILSLNAPLPPRFILRISSKQSLELMPKVLSLVDGILLSRSELGLEEHPHNLGILQKEVIETCNQNSKVIIVASELMESMRQNPTPTRAEVSDMANAMEDGADALLLSSEIIHGPYNTLVAKVSQEVLTQSEAWSAQKWKAFKIDHMLTDDDVVLYGAMQIAEEADVKAIVCFTEGGYTAYRLSAMRTPKNIIAITCNKRIFRQLRLLRSVQPVILSSKLKTEKLLPHIKNLLTKRFKFKTGDRFVFVSLTTSSIAQRNSNLFTLQEIE